MKITFQNAPENTTDYVHSNRPHQMQQSQHLSAGDAKAVKVDFHTMGQGDFLPQGGRFGGVGALEQVRRAAESIDAGVQQNYMTLMSNIMSEEDYAKLEKEGFPLRQMKPEEAVTIVDKIKAEVARSGKQIAGYNDDLDLETLAAALGSQTLAQQVNSSFAKADLPMNEDTVDALQKAWDMASKLSQPTEGMYQYMLREGMEPEISSFYMAQSSGAGMGNQNSAMFYSEEVQGYYTQAAGQGDLNWDAAGELAEQIRKVITDAGLEPDEESREAAQWMLKHNIPLTSENLVLYKDLTQVPFPISEEAFAKAASLAVLQGNNPINANLGTGVSDNIYEKANQIFDEYSGETFESLADNHLENRRILEEIRLRMTAEVNVKLLQSGFAIDTAPMEDLLEAIKIAQRQVAEQYFPEDTEALSKYELYQTTNRVVEEIPQMPASLLGTLPIREVPSESTDTLEGTSDGSSIKLTTLSAMHQAGRELLKYLDAAREGYETMMTAPRADMGDSILKAFANVDEILKDLGFEPTEENRKAVRVLGYNRMELSAENIDKVREAKRLVSGVIEKMTPAAVLKMIRDGVNPLEKNFEELQDYFEELPKEYGRKAESYSRFLYRLEQRGEISQEERDSFIGIYRMLHQIEKKDGAAVGGVLNTNAELQFANLLSAARSRRFGSMDVRLTDREESYIHLEKGDNAIDSQIERAYIHQQLEDVRRASHAQTEQLQLLERGEMPATVDNLLAAMDLTDDENAPFGKPKKAQDEANDNLPVSEGTAKEVTENGLMDLWQELDEPERFAEHFKEYIEELTEQARQDTWQQENYLDVRSLKQLSVQLSIAGKLSDNEEYFLPLEISKEKTGRLHLVFHKGEEKGKVTVETQLQGRKNYAEFRVQNGMVTGFLHGNGRQEVMKLSQAADIFTEYLKEEASFSMDAKLSVVDTAKAVDTAAAVVRSKTTTEKLFDSADGEAQQMQQPNRADLYRLAKLWIRAVTQKEAEDENQL